MTRSISSLNGARKAEVHDLDIVALVKQDILRLQVTVREAKRVYAMNALQQLIEIELAGIFGQGTAVENVVE